MDLKILVPSQIFLEGKNILAITVDTDAGELQFLPNRLDCVVLLKPGLLSFRTQLNKTVYVATDNGMVVKCGPLVTVSVRRAIGGSNLKDLQAVVEKEFLKLTTIETNTRTVLTHMENEFISRFLEFQNG